MAENWKENLISIADRPEEERREIGRKGGIASGKARKEKATMLSVLANTLDETNEKSGKTYRELATLGLIKGAINGSGKNYEIISNLMEQKEKSDESKNLIISIPAKDIGKPYSEIVEEARKYINEIGGFEKFAEWGLF